MAALFQFPYVLGIPLLPVRRVIAIDPGSHALKFIVIAAFRRRAWVLQLKIVNLTEEGLISPEEIGPFVQNTLREMGDYPVAVALPQNIPLSQLVDLSSGSNGVRQLIERETAKNRDMHDSPVVYDCLKLPSFGKHSNAFWVTLCKEKDVFAQINRLALVPEDVCEVASGANALAATWRRVSPQTGLAGLAALVDFGASSTSVVMVVEGQPVQSVSFPIGGNLLTEAIANQKKCSLEAAENLKRSQNLFAENDQIASLLPVVDSWRKEVERIISDWRRDNPEMASDFPVVLGGGNAMQPGLLEYLNRARKDRFTFWPSETEKELAPQLAGVYGTALQALGLGQATGALLPEELRSHWAGQRTHQRVLSATFFLLAMITLLLGIGTIQKISHALQKQEWLDQARIALEKQQSAEALQQEAILTYERLRPVFKRQQQTFDTLATLSLISSSRTNQNLWHVLLADQQSYFTGNTTIATNGTSGSATNAPKRGFVAELCINEEGEARRRTLSQTVADLKQNPLFSNVDSLPVDRRKNLANPSVVLPESHFALALELAGDDFQQSMLVPDLSTNSPAAPTPTEEPIQIAPTNRIVWPVTNDYE